MEIIVDDQEVIADLGTELAPPPAPHRRRGFRPRRLGAGHPGGARRRSRRRAGARPGQARGRARRSRPAARRPARAGASGRDPRRRPTPGANSSLRYYSASSDRESTRIVDPVSVRLHRRATGISTATATTPTGMRRFRVDRVSEARLTGEPAAITGTTHATGPVATTAPRAPRPSSPGPRPPWPTSPSTTTRCGSPRRCSTRRRSRSADGRTGVTLAVASTVWFGRLLLRLGPHAEVLDPPELAETGRQAARQLLARYRRRQPRPESAETPRSVARSPARSPSRWARHRDNRGWSRHRAGRRAPEVRVLRVAKVRKGGHAYYLEVAGNGTGTGIEAPGSVARHGGGARWVWAERSTATRSGRCSRATTRVTGRRLGPVP